VRSYQAKLKPAQVKDLARSSAILGTQIRRRQAISPTIPGLNEAYFGIV
jgi:hypothetical protein